MVASARGSGRCSKARPSSLWPVAAQSELMSCIAVSAGAMMKNDFKEGETPQPMGSFMIYKADNIDEARHVALLLC